MFRNFDEIACKVVEHHMTINSKFEVFAGQKLWTYIKHV